jgi:FKBP-type peptidyl-prolyl cis-trans isomerase (trigger factor)
VYPEPTAKTKKRESFKPKKINSDVTDAEVEESMLALKRQYAKYDKVEEITIDTFAKIKFSIVNKDALEIDK